jgi:uncharacterized MAPEG superfamily protein
MVATSAKRQLLDVLRNMSTHLQKVTRAATRSAEAREAFVAAIAEAHKAGESERAIGRAAGLSGPRIHQILKEDK